MNTGLDPEVLAVCGGFVMPAERFVPAPKRGPTGRLNHLSFDNAAVEMRPDHTSRRSRLVRRTGDLLRSAKVSLAMAIRRGDVPSLTKLSLTPAAPLLTKDTKLASVAEFGCSPSNVIDQDFNLYRVEPFCSAEDTNLRSAGFHLHQELLHPNTAQAAVAVLDGYVGLMDVIMNSRLGFLPEARSRRNKLGYGRAGEHRTRRSPSGKVILEYRVLSPWPLLGPEYTDWAITAMRTVCRQDQKSLMQVLEQFPSRGDIMQVINNSNDLRAPPLRQACVMVWNRTIGALNARQFSGVLAGRDIGFKSTGFSVNWTK